MDDVSDYYDRNTRSFLRFGRGSGATGAIHRAVWGPGVTSQRDALDFVHQRIEAVLRDTGVLTAAAAGVFVDLGCGVGGSMEAMYRRTDRPIAGVTLSAVQSATAGDRFRRAALGDVLAVTTGDFSDPDTIDRAIGAVLPATVDARPTPDPTGRLAAVWMIESYNHGDDIDRLLATLAPRMAPGAPLIICDDFPDQRLVDGALSRQERRWREEFRRGWHVHTFLTPEQLSARAAAHGFDRERVEDFSDWAAVDRPRDYAVRLVAGPAALLRLSSPWWDNLRGGNALQQLSKRRLVRYRMCVFTRTAA